MVWWISTEWIQHTIFSPQRKLFFLYHMYKLTLVLMSFLSVEFCLGEAPPEKEKNRFTLWTIEWIILVKATSAQLNGITWDRVLIPRENQVLSPLWEKRSHGQHPADKQCSKNICTESKSGSGSCQSNVCRFIFMPFAITTKKFRPGSRLSTLNVIVLWGGNQTQIRLVLDLIIEIACLYKSVVVICFQKRVACNEESKIPYAIHDMTERGHVRVS